MLIQLVRKSEPTFSSSNSSEESETEAETFKGETTTSQIGEIARLGLKAIKETREGMKTRASMTRDSKTRGDRTLVLVKGIEEEPSSITRTQETGDLGETPPRVTTRPTSQPSGALASIEV